MNYRPVSLKNRTNSCATLNNAVMENSIVELDNWPENWLILKFEHWIQGRGNFVICRRFKPHIPLFRMWIALVHQNFTIEWRLMFAPYNEKLRINYIPGYIVHYNKFWKSFQFYVKFHIHHNTDILYKRSVNRKHIIQYYNLSIGSFGN